jgi:hypothetical protein
MTSTLQAWPLLLSCAVGGVTAAPPATRHPLDPLGQVHIAIGLPNSVDQLKTFVEAEGSFSPGFGTYGVSFWVWNEHGRRPDGSGLTAATMEGVRCEHGLGPGGLLMPWARWRAGSIEVRSELCQVACASPTGEVQVVAARVRLTNTGTERQQVRLIAWLRPLGPAGGPVRALAVSDRKDALLVDGHAALLSMSGAQGGCALPADTIGAKALVGDFTGDSASRSAEGQCSGALLQTIALAPDASAEAHFVCPVAAGRRVAGHRWDGVSPWAQYDLARPNDPEGELQPDPGLDFYRTLQVDALFAQTADSLKRLQQRVGIRVPDACWSEAFSAGVGHAALCMNQGAPDAAVANYNVYSRDGMYMANIFQKAGLFDLAATAIDYFLHHPFNGRAQPEADNPGQILWVMGEHWQFTHDRAWLARVYPAVRKLTAMIRYYRTTPGPHWVCDTSLDFGEALPSTQRKELKPGACDGFNPIYTEAYDVAGLRGAALLAEAQAAVGANSAADDAAAWRKVANDLLVGYTAKFGKDLARGYGSYSVLWPCRLYPFDTGPAHEQFKSVAVEQPTSWRYFPLARAHQGLLTGNREAGFGTLRVHLAHPQMKSWYAFDEGGPSGVGGWHHLEGFSSWKVHPKGEGNHEAWAVAMPHGWSIAESHLLLRDSLAYEDGDRLVLLAGVPPEWFWSWSGIQLTNFPTHFGPCSLDYTVQGNRAMLKLDCAAPGGCLLALPESARVITTTPPSAPTRKTARGWLLPSGTQGVMLEK